MSGNAASRPREGLLEPCKIFHIRAAIAIKVHAAASVRYGSLGAKPVNVAIINTLCYNDTRLNLPLLTDFPPSRRYGCCRLDEISGDP